MSEVCLPGVVPSFPDTPPPSSTGLSPYSLPLSSPTSSFSEDLPTGEIPPTCPHTLLEDSDWHAPIFALRQCPVKDAEKCGPSATSQDLPVDLLYSPRWTSILRLEPADSSGERKGLSTLGRPWKHLLRASWVEDSVAATFRTLRATASFCV